MRVVVVGASSGLGRSIATGLGQRGAAVALLARRQDRLERAAKEAGDGAVPIVCDVCDPQSVDTAMAAAAEQLGGIDGLVYATGIGELAKLVDHDVDQWHRAFDTNVIGAWQVTAAALPHLEAIPGRRRLPLVGQRVAHAALARTGLLRGEQGCARQARGGVAGRAPADRLHPRRGR